MNKLKLIISIVISVIPINSLKILFYRVIGYKIGKGTKIGFGTILISDVCLIGNNVIIGRNNRIKAKTLEIGSNSRIGNNNKLYAWENYSGSIKDSNFIRIGDNCLITQGHLLDGSFGVEIGSDTWIAGRNSSLWSHGSSKAQKPIVIGRKCYIGSEVRIGTDVVIGNEVLVGMGSVVLKGCPSKSMLVGSPAVVKRENYIWHENWD